MRELVYKFKNVVRWTAPKLFYQMRERYQEIRGELQRMTKRSGIGMNPQRNTDALHGIDLRPGDLAIDCGAHVGNITARMASKGAIVYAFEPNPYIYQILKQRFSAAANVHCVNKGVLDRNDRVRLYLHENTHADKFRWSEGSSLLSCSPTVSVDTFVEVEVVDLSEFIDHLNTNIRVVKIYVEGVEFQIINRLIDSGAIKKIEFLLV